MHNNVIYIYINIVWTVVQRPGCRSNTAPFVFKIMVYRFFLNVSNHLQELNILHGYNTVHLNAILVAGIHCSATYGL